MAVNKFQSGGVDNNWGTTGNWSTGAVPTAADGNVATFDASSPNCTVNISNRVCNGIDFTGYTNTITMTFNITSSGAITLGSAMVIAGSGSLTLNATATITSNGKTWPNAFSITTGGTNTTTLADDWTIGGLLTIGLTTAIYTLTGNNFMPLAGLRYVGTTGFVSGTTLFKLTVTQTLDAPSLTTGRGMLCPITINAPGQTITISGSFPIDFSKLTYTAGTVITANTWPSASGGGLLLNPGLSGGLR